MRRALPWLLGVLCLPFVLLAAAAIFGSTAAGQRWLALQAVEQVNRQIEGRISLDRAAIRLDGVVLEGLRLFPPESEAEAVVEAARVQVAPALGLGMLGGRIQVHHALLAGVRVEQVAAADGGPSDLERAVAPRNPGAPGGEGGGSWQVAIDRLVLEDGAYRLGTAEEPATLELSGLALTLQGVLDEAGARITGAAAASFALPVGAEGKVAVEATIDQGWSRLQLRRLDGSVGGSTFSVAGSGDLETLTAELSEIRLRLLPADAAALVPGWSPTVPLAVRGSASFREGKLSTRLELEQEGDGETLHPVVATDRAPAARHLTLEAELQPVSGSWRLDAAATALDPRGFDASLPAGAVDLRAALRGDSLRSGGGSLELPLVTLGTGSAGPLQVDAHFDGERIDLRALRLALAGGRLEAAGWAAPDRLDLRFDLDTPAADRLLGEATRLAAAAGVELPQLQLQGAVRLQGRVHGSTDAPAVAASLRAPTLVVADQRFVSLRGEVDVAGLPAAPTGKASLQAARVELGGTPVEALAADLHLAGNRVRGTLDGTTPAGRLQAALDLQQAGGWERIRFDRLDLRWPGTSWGLRRAATVELVDGVELRELALASDHGASIDGRVRLGAGGALALELTATGVDLTRLPPSFALEERGLAGIARAEARLGGTLARPTGQVALALDAGAFGGVEGIGAALDLALDGRSVQLRANGSHAAARVDASGTLGWPLAAGASLDLEATVHELDLAQLARLLALDETPAGTVGAQLALGGTLGAPRGTLSIAGRNLGVRGLEGGTATIQLLLQEGVSLEADATWAEGGLHAAVQLDDRPEALLAAPERLLDRPLRGTLEARGIDVAPLLRTRPPGAELALAPARARRGGERPARTEPPLRLRGRASLVAAVEGSLRHPRGTASVELVDFWNDTMGPFDGEVRLSATAAATEVELESRLLGRRLVAGTLRATAAPELLLERQALRTTRLEGDLATTDLEVGAVAWALGHRSETLGTANGTFRLRGTAAAPELEVDTRVEGLTLGGASWGDVALVARYRDRDLGGTLLLRGSEGGEARVEGGWKVDLGLPAVAEGSLASLAEAPLDLGVTARALELAFLEGISADLRQAEGRLDADVKVRGTPANPSLEGAVAVRGGRFGYTGYGEVRDVAVELELQPLALRLRRLEASATGRLTASGGATRPTADAPWSVDVGLQARRFAITTSDLVRGWMEADARLTGTAGPAGIDTRLAVERAKIELADTPAKDVQSLDDHPDFLVVRGGALGLVTGRRQARERERRVPQASGRPVMLEIESKRPVEVDGSDVSLAASSDLKLLLLDGEPQLVGGVQVLRGHVLVMSRRFEVTRGRVHYTGAEPPGDPRLDVVVRHESPHASVTVTVAGTLQKPITQLRSNPPMSEAEIATLLATGRPQPKAGAGGTSGASSAASAVGAVLTTQLKKGLAAKLPVDVISFEAGDEDFQGSRLEAGTYVNDRIYVGYARRFEDTRATDRKNANEVRMEYQLSPRWSLEVTYGDAAVGGADLMWTRDF